MQDFKKTKLVVGLLLVSTALIAAFSFGLPKSLSEWGFPSAGQMIQTTPQEVLKHVKGLNRPLVLVNFWATWCEPCKTEFPALVRLAQSYKDQGLAVVFVSIDNKAEEKEAAEFLRSHNIPPPYLYKGSQPLSFVAELYPKWQGSIPTSLLLQPDGRLIATWETETSYEEFTKIIDQHLPGDHR